MLKQYLFLFCLVIYSHTTMSQQAAELPYRELSAPPKAITAGGIAARMVDGLGFRYYWVTEGLRAEDLAYRPSPEARSTAETLNHIYSLAQNLLLTVTGKPVVDREDGSGYSLEVLRAKTLNTLKQASKILYNSTEADFARYTMAFSTDAAAPSLSFWYQLNGPIADALWHTGQVASFRRSSGNPMDNKVSVLQGRRID